MAKKKFQLKARISASEIRSHLSSGGLRGEEKRIFRLGKFVFSGTPSPAEDASSDKGEGDTQALPINKKLIKYP